LPTGSLEGGLGLELAPRYAASAEQGISPRPMALGETHGSPGSPLLCRPPPRRDGARSLRSARILVVCSAAAERGQVPGGLQLLNLLRLVFLSLSFSFGSEPGTLP